MGIFDALNTSVGGLQAQSFALQNISGNIANASTIGYKGIDTSFEDLDSGRDDARAGRSPAASRPSRKPTITTQGTVSATRRSRTNMAITGDGFFNVQKPTGVVDNVPVFYGVTDYTRRGDFQVNANGNLVNGAGYYLMGVPVDPKTGNPLGNVPQVLQFQNNFIPAQATTRDPIRRQPADQAERRWRAPPRPPARSRRPGGLNPADFRRLQSAADRHAGRALYRRHHHRWRGATTRRRRRPRSPPQRSCRAPRRSNSICHRASRSATPSRSTAPRSPSSRPATGRATQHRHRPTTSATLLAKIDAITGTRRPSTRRRRRDHAAHRHRAEPDITSRSVRRSRRSASAPTVVARRGGGGTAGAGVVIGNDLTTFTNESISGGAVTAYNATGTPVNLQLRWAKTDSASLGAGHIGYLEPVLSDQSHRDRHADRPGSMPAPISSSAPTARWRQPDRIVDQHSRA